MRLRPQQLPRRPPLERQLMLREPDEIALHGNVFDTLREAARFDEDVRELLGGLLKELSSGG